MTGRSKFLFEMKKLCTQRLFLLVTAVIVIACAVFTLLYQAPSEAVNIPDGYAEKYVSDLERTIAYAENNVADYGMDGENYIVRYNRNVIEVYGKMLARVTPEPVTGYGELILSYGQPLWVILFALLLGASCTLFESETGMSTMLGISKGRKKVYRAKITLFSVTSFASAIVIFAIQAVTIGARFDFTGLCAPLVSVPFFELCPYNIAVWQYIVLLILWNALLAFAISTLSALIGKQTESYIVTFVFGLAGVLLFESEVFDINLMFARYETLNTFGLPVIKIFILLAVLSVMIAVCGTLLTLLPTTSIGMSLLTSAENAVRSFFKKHITSAKRSNSHRYVRKSLFSYELKKLLMTSGMLLLVVCALGTKCYFSFTAYRHEKLSADLYEREYYLVATELSGEITDEKTALVSQKLTESHEIISQSDQMRENVHIGLITREEYNAYLTRLEAAYIDASTYSRIDSQVKFIRANDYNTAEIMYETGWTRLLSRGADAILLLTLVFLFSGAYATDYRDGAIDLISTSKKGVGALHKAKFLSAITIGAALCLLFGLIDFVAVATAFPLDKAGTSALSLPAVTGLRTDIPIFLQLVANKLSGLVFYTCFGYLTCLASLTLKKTYFVLPLMFLLVAVIM